MCCAYCVPAVMSFLPLLLPLLLLLLLLLPPHAPSRPLGVVPAAGPCRHAQLQPDAAHRPGRAAAGRGAAV
jgi:hypothetical protein